MPRSTFQNEDILFFHWLTLLRCQPSWGLTLSLKWDSLPKVGLLTLGLLHPKTGWNGSTKLLTQYWKSSEKIWRVILTSEFPIGSHWTTVYTNKTSTYHTTPTLSLLSPPHFPFLSQMFVLDTFSTLSPAHRLPPQSLPASTEQGTWKFTFHILSFVTCFFFSINSV